MTIQDSLTTKDCDSDDGANDSGAQIVSLSALDAVKTNHNASVTPEASGYGVNRNWLAELSLGFVAGPDKTLMKEFRFKGPLRVQRPFYPEGAPCHIYILHPPGGLVSGDNLKIDIDCQKNSHAVLTTPSAGKIYQADSCNVKQHQNVKLRLNEAICEWLPQETIVFNGANGCLDTEIDLTENAKFIGWDIYCLGRTAGNKPFDQGSVVQSLKVTKDGVPLLIERQIVNGGGTELTQRYGFSGHSVSGTLIVYGLGSPQSAVESLRESIDIISSNSPFKGMLAVTQRLGVLLVRYLGPCSEEGKNLFIHCWKHLRKELLGLEASEPRIWLT